MKKEVRFTITASAAMVKMSRQNLHKTYIKTGLLSVSRDEQNKPFVDLSELIRVFPALRIDDTVNDNLIGKVALVDTDMAAENHNLREKLDQLLHQLMVEKARAERAEDGERWARSVADKALDAMKLLEHKKPIKDSWIKRLFKY